MSEAKSILIVMDCSCSCEKNVCFTQNDAKTTMKLRFRQNEKFDTGLDLQRAVIQRMETASKEKEMRMCKIEGVEVYSEKSHTFISVADYFDDILLQAEREDDDNNKNSSKTSASVRAMRCNLVTKILATHHKDGINIKSKSSTPATIKCISWKHFDVDGEAGLPYAGTMLRIREQVNQGTGTGLNLWDGAILLAKYLEQFPENVQGKYVLELGSGCGMVGIAAAILGARKTTLTDLSYTLPIMKANVERNMSNIHIDHQIECAECDWFDPPPLVNLGFGVRATCCDDSTTTTCNVTVILIADCVWVDDLVAPLLRTLRLYTDDDNANDCTVWISYQQRGSRAHELFWNGIHELFSSVVEVDIRSLVQSSVLHIFACRR